MDRIIELVDVVRREVVGYNTRGFKSRSVFLENAAEQRFCIVVVPDYEPGQRRRSTVMVMAVVQGEYIVIEEDTTDRPLWEALVRAGIPRDRIVLAYAGESAP